MAWPFVNRVSLRSPRDSLLSQSNGHSVGHEGWSSAVHQSLEGCPGTATMWREGRREHYSCRHRGRRSAAASNPTAKARGTFPSPTGPMGGSRHPRMDQRQRYYLPINLRKILVLPVGGCRGGEGSDVRRRAIAWCNTPWGGAARGEFSVENWRSSPKAALAGAFPRVNAGFVC